MIRRLLQSRTGARAPVTRGERHTTNETATITIIIMTESCRRAPVKYFMCVCVTWRAARGVFFYHMAESTAETTKQFFFRNNLDFCDFFFCRIFFSSGGKKLDEDFTFRPPSQIGYRVSSLRGYPSYRIKRGVS